MLLATAQGEVKKTPLKEFESVRRDGLIAMDLEKGDELVAAKLVHDDDDDRHCHVERPGDPLPASATLRSASRTTGGVRGIKLDEGRQGRRAGGRHADGHELLTLSENGSRQAHAVRGVPAAPAAAARASSPTRHAEDRQGRRGAHGRTPRRS